VTCHVVEYNRDFFSLWNRTSGSNGSDLLLSPVRDKPDKEFINIQLKDLEVIATLGMGGFGRVELVS
jgi:hypothetical protein